MVNREIVLTREEIEDICFDIGSKLDTRFIKENVESPVFIGVLKGSLNFMMDLIKYITKPIQLDFIQASSYNGTQSSGAVILKKDISLDIKDKTIVIVEDVIDTGLTMEYLVGYLKKRYEPKEIIVVSLFDKLFMRKANIHIDYVGKTLDADKFLLGYGLDYNELYRNIPYVFNATKAEIDYADKITGKK